MNKIKKIFFAITSLFLVAARATACKEKDNPQEVVDDVYVLYLEKMVLDVLTVFL